MVEPSYERTIQQSMREPSSMFGFVIRKVVGGKEKEELGKTKGIINTGEKWSRLKF